MKEDQHGVSGSIDRQSCHRARTAFLDRTTVVIIADRGRSYAEVLQPEASKVPLDRARELATALLSERGEASGAAVARELQISLHELGPADRVSFYRFLVENFLPAETQLRAAAEAYLAEPTPERATQLAQAAEPTRQELLRRMNMAQGGTAALVAMRKDLLSHLRSEPGLKPLDSDLRHLLGSWSAKALGLTIPETLLAIADEVIQ